MQYARFSNNNRATIKILTDYILKLEYLIPGAALNV